ncbi:Hypothetical predicted protein [Mytilus galloprovincialis]|uniref:Uncharacterized protein n=1 Tax=Mytilus galloprovincialis TaxID=29158 RepID=A0A8B6G503_MYTGA|nr:Hypothetical predicted protein [Mytilus galloprovincialis]
MHPTKTEIIDCSKQKTDYNWTMGGKLVKTTDCSDHLGIKRTDWKEHNFNLKREHKQLEEQSMQLWALVGMNILEEESQKHSLYKHDTIQGYTSYRLRLDNTLPLKSNKKKQTEQPYPRGKKGDSSTSQDNIWEATQTAKNNVLRDNPGNNFHAKKPNYPTHSLTSPNIANPATE